MQYPEMSKIEAAFEGRDRGLFVVHGSTGTGKSTLMRAISLRLAMQRRLREIDVSTTKRSCAIPTDEWVAGFDDPRLVIFGEIVDRRRAERAVALARHAIVVAEMPDERPDRVIGQLVDHGIPEDNARRSLLGQASLAKIFEEPDQEEAYADWSPWYRKGDGVRIGILVGEHGA